MSTPDTENDPALTNQPPSSDAPSEALPGEIERSIREFSAEYLNHIRSLSKAFERFYSEQLAARDERLRDLTQQLSASQDEITHLHSQLAALRQENEALRMERQHVEEHFSLHLRRLREMSDGLERELGVSSQPNTDGDGDRADDGRRT